jgi:hypothetical protein
MDNHQIELASDGFRIIEIRPDGPDISISGFDTMVDAEGWLDSYRILLGSIDCMTDGPIQSGKA